MSEEEQIPTSEQVLSLPSGPMLNFQIADKGVIFTFLFGNGFEMKQHIDAANFQQMCKLWLESRQELMKQQQIVAHALRTKR